MSVALNLQAIRSSLPPGVTLVAVTKTHPPSLIMEAYQAGHRIFGENKVQELLDKRDKLPEDIQWHLIGHLQSNKVKYIAPFISLIHSVDSFRLLQEINKQAEKSGRVIDCLLQLHIASEETKFGLSFDEALALLHSDELPALKHIRITGLMGMASNTEDVSKVRSEFNGLAVFFAQHRAIPASNVHLTILSMGMSSDYRIALEEGSNMIRVGSSIFGHR